MTTFQLFPALDAATEAALRASVKRWGVLVPIAVDQHGRILDGHHRHRIAAELDVECPVAVVNVDGDQDAEEIAHTLNTARRHLPPEQRREIVADLRADGHSTRAIAGAVGVSEAQVRKDIAAEELRTGTQFTPDRIVGLDGKSRPATRPERAADALATAEPERTLDDIAEEADAVIETIDDDEPVEPAVSEAVESRRTPVIVPKRTVGDDIPPHPATYPAAVLELFREIIPAGSTVLDPFAGVGTIHQLGEGYTTTGVELEYEWAIAHPSTVCGDSRTIGAGGLFDGMTFDAVATSPAYGNRLADDYRASDPDSRRSYAIDLGRSLSDGSGAGLHFDADGAYEELHEQVWRAVVGVLRPGGLFVLNCKDFQRNGKIMPVTGWHVGLLAQLGMVAIDLRCLPAKGLPFASASPISEVVVVLRKPA